MGIFVLNYIDNIIGIAPDEVADSHFQLTINTLSSLGFHLNSSKTMAPTSVATCLGITFDIQIGVLQILSLCNFYVSKSKISKQKLQALIGSLMLLHKAFKPAQLFINRILALLREMGDANVVAIDEGFHRDLQWFIACAQVVNGSVTIFKCVQPRLDIFVDASLSGLGGVLNAFAYRRALVDIPGWCIAHWEALNVLVALKDFSPFLSHQRVTV
jgi:hypothetical protein